MRDEVTISFDEQTGEVQFVHHDEIADVMSEVGTITKSRATHVEPVSWILRCLFYLIRNRVDDSSRLSSFTRRWPCKWRARLTDTNEIIGVGRDRAALIQNEVEYLENERI